MDDRLVDERLRLSAAREQLETARTREEELLNELQILHASQVVTEMGQITEGDVNDLKAAFKKDLEDVLGFVREFSQPTAAQEETAETALEESEDEEAVAENLGDFRQVVAAAVKSLSSKQLNKLLRAILLEGIVQIECSQFVRIVLLVDHVLVKRHRQRKDCHA